MNAKDLMIGDWVNVFDSPKQIEGIKKFRNGDEIVYYDGDNGNFIKAVTPIPLTEEILEKNGFKRLQDTYLFNITTNQFGVNLWLEIGPDSWVENNKIRVDSLKGDFNYPMLTVTTCEYVHEFQHLLKLFGIKKDIKI